jgi:branched-chain amino acid transport system substrate-binding protein
MRMQIIKLLILSLLIFTLSCTNKEIKPATTPNPILIGAIYDLTGDQSQYGIASSRGAELAVKKINDAGGVFGRPLHLILRDGESNPKKIKREARQLAENPDISVVIGLSDSNMVLAAAPEVASYKKIFITSGATSPHLPQDVPRYLFLSCFGDNTQASAAAEYMYERLGLRDVAVIFDRDMVYTIGLSAYFQDRFTQLGGKIVSLQSYSHNNPSLEKQIETLKTLDVIPQFIYLAAETPGEASLLVSELRSAGVYQPIMGGDSYVAKLLIDTIGNAADNIFFTTHVYFDINTENSELKKFIDVYESTYKTFPSNPFAALGYDTVNLVVLTMRGAGSLDSQSLLKVLDNTKDFKGATGSISYQSGLKVPLKSVSIVHIKDGEATLATEWIPEKIPAPVTAK